MDHTAEKHPPAQSTGEALHFLQSLHDLTLAADAALDRDDWEDALAVIDQRSQLIETLSGAFESYVESLRGSEAQELEAEHAEVRAAAERLQVRQLRITARLEQFHSETGRRLGHIGHGSRAAHAYLRPDANHAIDVQG